MVTCSYLLSFSDSHHQLANFHHLVIFLTLSYLGWCGRDHKENILVYVATSSTMSCHHRLNHYYTIGKHITHIYFKYLPAYICVGKSAKFYPYIDTSVGENFSPHISKDTC